jgi:hypothetical protein
MAFGQCAAESVSGDHGDMGVCTTVGMWCGWRIVRLTHSFLILFL